MLSRLVDRPVVDETGIKGNYQVELDPDAAFDPSGGSVFAAVQARSEAGTTQGTNRSNHRRPRPKNSDRKLTRTSKGLNIFCRYRN
jgi:uncharacterized protein (TIGR03435 family)